MTAEENRILGQLAGQIDAMTRELATMRAETRRDFEGVFDRLNKISSEGCMEGKRNEERIKTLEQRPERNVSMLAAIASIVSATLASIAYWRPFG